MRGGFGSLCARKRLRSSLKSPNAKTTFEHDSGSHPLPQAIPLPFVLGVLVAFSPQSSNDPLAKAGYANMELGQDETTQEAEREVPS